MLSIGEKLDNNSSHSFSETNPQISILVPAYNEERNLHKLYVELIRVLHALNLSWEIIFVDDGSTDKTWDQILSMRKNDMSVKGIRLSRNFGHQYALFAGLSHAVGDAVISMDADLQHPPQVIPNLVSEWKRGNKIVNTIRIDPEDFSFFKKTAARMFYAMFTFLSGVKIERGMADFRLLDRQVVDNILEFREEGLFLRGIVQWVGYPNSKIKYQSSNRYSGTSKYGMKKMVRLGLDGIRSFSLVPLRIGIFLGIATSALSFGGIVYAFYSKFIAGNVVPGWTSSLSVLSFLFGILFILLGLIGDYIGRIVIEIKQRPRFLISDRVGVDGPPAKNHSYSQKM